MTFTKGVRLHSSCIKQLVNSMKLPKKIAINSAKRKSIMEVVWLFCRQNSPVEWLNFSLFNELFWPCVDAAINSLITQNSLVAERRKSLLCKYRLHINNMQKACQGECAQWPHLRKMRFTNILAYGGKLYLIYHFTFHLLICVLWYTFSPWI